MSLVHTSNHSCDPLGAGRLDDKYKSLASNLWFLLHTLPLGRGPHSHQGATRFGCPLTGSELRLMCGVGIR